MTSEQYEAARSVREDRITAFLIDFAALSVATFTIWGVFFVLKIIIGVGGSAGLVMMDATESMGGPAGAGLSIGMIVVEYGLPILQWLLIGAVLAGYFVYFVTNGGQTLGMRVTDVRVVGEDTPSLTQFQALLRTAVLLAPFPVMALVSIFIPLIGLPVALAMMSGWLLIEAVVLLVSENAQRLGDMLANTLVVPAD